MKVHFRAIGDSVELKTLALLGKGYQVTGNNDVIFEPARLNPEETGLLAKNGWHTEPIPHTIENGNTTITAGGKCGFKVIGDHNLPNHYPAWYAYRDTGSAKQFTETMQDYKVVSKRPEEPAENNETILCRNFSHASSELMASILAVRRLYPKRKLITVFELHTNNNFNEKFLKQYSGAMDEADAVVVVVYSKHALELKRLPDLYTEKIKEGFNRKDLLVFDDKNEFINWLYSFTYGNANLLLMSSGNFDGADMLTFAKQVNGSNI